jgi:hypothetical protein
MCPAAERLIPTGNRYGILSGNQIYIVMRLVNLREQDIKHICFVILTARFDIRGRPKKGDIQVKKENYD